MQIIQVEEVRKEFRLRKPDHGPWYKKPFTYFRPDYKNVVALDGISFSIAQGERVAFIGPNGAGKSTALKILTGIMLPSSGQVKVLGKIPSKERTSLAYDISAIFGHCSQLWYHLPIRQSFELIAAIYDIDATSFKNRLNYLIEYFHLSHLLQKSVRQLSLGERMKCEVVASFLHTPKVIFLDEPTIGLDFRAKTTIRDFLITLSEEQQSTLLLTSHDMDDIEKVCTRVIIIDHGKLVLDRSVATLKRDFVKKKIVTISSEENLIDYSFKQTKVIDQQPSFLKLEIDLAISSVNEVVSDLLNRYSIKDITIENPSLETIIQTFYAQTCLQQ